MGFAAPRDTADSSRPHPVHLIPGASIADGRYRLLVFHGGPEGLQFWQALGLLLLSRLLFGGLRGRAGWHGHWRQRMWRERWESMTPEERARLREHYQQRCGHRGTAVSEPPASPPGA